MADYAKYKEDPDSAIDDQFDQPALSKIAEEVQSKLIIFETVPGTFKIDFKRNVIRQEVFY